MTDSTAPKAEAPKPEETAKDAPRNTAADSAVRAAATTPADGASDTAALAPAQPALPPPHAGALRLLAQLVALAIGVFAMLSAIVFFVPDGNDYCLATVTKHARLAQTERSKIVLVGGSNLAYGVASDEVAKATGRHVVNMGMNGYLGVRFMLEEIKPDLRPHDLVVIALEYDSFVKTVDGAGKDLLMIAKTRPASFAHLTPPQLMDVVGVVPYAAQKKSLRLISDLLQGFRKRAEADAEPGGDVPLQELPEDQLVAAVETFSGFNEYGDLESHLEVDFPYEREQGLDLTALGIDPEVVGLLQGFSREMAARDVKVVLSYSPVLRSFYDKHRALIAELHKRLTARGHLTVPLPPEAFVFDEPLFFDTVYHLNARGRLIRTRKLLGSLTPHLIRAAATP